MVFDAGNASTDEEGDIKLCLRVGVQQQHGQAGDATGQNPPQVLLHLRQVQLTPHVQTVPCAAWVPNKKGRGGVCECEGGCEGGWVLFER